MSSAVASSSVASRGETLLRACILYNTVVQVGSPNRSEPPLPDIRVLAIAMPIYGLDFPFRVLVLVTIGTESIGTRRFTLTLLDVC